MKRHHKLINIFTLAVLSLTALAVYSPTSISSHTGIEPILQRQDDVTSQDPTKKSTPEIHGVILGQGALSVSTFYDFNANGFIDPSEVELINWPVTISPLGILEFPPFSLELSASQKAYTATEGVPLETNWVHSTPSSITFDIVVDGTQTCSFGNYCTIPSGGHGLGFWSNRNGQSLLTEADFAELTDRKLVNFDGSNCDFSSSLAANKAALKSWLLNADGVNAAYMLSVQLAIMKLNVLHNFVDGNTFALCYGGTINNLCNATNTALVADQSTFANDANRNAQETLKSCLDGLNNGAPVVPVTPCSYTFP